MGILILCIGIAFAAEPVKMTTPVKIPSTAGLAKATPVPFNPQAGQGGTFFLSGPISQSGVIVTGKGEQETKFTGQIRFIATQGKKGERILVLDRLNLVSEGVPTEKGESGVLGVNLVNRDNAVTYDPKSGEFSTEFTSTLHYALIDDILGFTEAKSAVENDLWISQTEEMKGTMKGTFPQGMVVQDKQKASIQSELVMKLEKEKLGMIREIRCKLSIADLIWSLTSPADVLRVQPVFIGSGPSDPDATGWVYEPLIRNASMIWGRCGTVNCISIMTNDPIYIDNDDYLILDNPEIDSAEATALRAEVSLPDAVEVFIVDRWDPLYNGGGATWGSGTANTKIITCDMQLDVPCPIPAEVCSRGSCGAVNYLHLGHELGHSMNLAHPGDPHGTLIEATRGTVMEGSGLCLDNLAVQSAHNCRSASSPLFTAGRSICTGSPDI